MDRLSSTCQDNIIIAWATPVSLAQLGARLEAYAETKVAITTFRIAVRNSAVTACHNLPEEIISMISNKVRDIASKRKTKKWTTVTKCLTNTCDSLFHVSKEDLDMMDQFGDLPDEAEYEAAEAHQKDVIRYCKKLSNLEGSSKFAKCAQVFARDFGIRPYFMVHKTFDDEDCYADSDSIVHVNAKAFLTLPVFLGPITSNAGPEVAAISVCKTIDPSALRGLSEGQIRQFNIATCTLRLHPYDPETDQPFSEDKHEVDGWPRLMMLGCGEFKAFERGC